MEHDKIECFNCIIIGGGIAGTTCAEHLNILDTECKALLITATDTVKTTTNVQSLTKTLDHFDVEERNYKDVEESISSVSIIQSIVKSLDSVNQIVHTSSKSYSYKKLCICSGALPNIIDKNNPYVICIRDTDSVKNFQNQISKAKRILIVGNGGIATEMVYEITGVEVIWAIKDKSINAVFIDPGAAEFLRPNLYADKQEIEKIVKRKKYIVDSNSDLTDKDKPLGSALGPDWHSGLELGPNKERKIVLETEVEVKKIFTPDQGKSDEWPVYVELSNGKVYGCDVVVSATGVIPNTHMFLEGNDFKLGDDGGLLVNEKLETSVANVYAAGDVCSAGWSRAHHWFQLRLWTQARQMGSYAAKCMWAALNGEEMYMDFCFELFSHATKFMGHKVILLGLYNGQKLDGKYEILLRMTKGKEYVKCVMVDGRMQGATLVGETDLEETFENLILNQMDLSSYGEDLLDPSVDIEDYFD